MLRKIRKELKKLISLVLVTVIVLGVVPLETILSRAAPTGGFEISLNWNDNEDKENYLYESRKDESRVVRLNVKYSNKEMKDTFAKGTVAITVPGIGGAERGSVIRASSVAADQAKSQTKEYAWSYTYNSADDTYTFTNNNELSPNSHFAGSFEILWTIDSRTSKTDYETQLQAVLRSTDGIEVTSNEVTYKQVRFKDDYEVTMRAPKLDYTGQGLDSGMNPDDYWWVNYEAVSILRRQSLGVHTSRTEILLPEGAELRFAEANWNNLSMAAVTYSKSGGTEVIDGVTYEVWELDMSVHSEEYSSKVLEFLVIYPKDKFDEEDEVSVYTRTIGIYNDGVYAEEELAEGSIEVVLNDYPYPEYTGYILWAGKTGEGIGKETAFAAQHSQAAYQNGYIDARHIRNGEREYTFQLQGSVRYPRLENGIYDIYDLELIDEKVEVQTVDDYRELEDGEYEITSITIPANKDVLNQNKVPVAPCKIEIYIREGKNSPYTLFSDTYSLDNSKQVVVLPEHTTGVKIIFLELQESIEVTVPVTMKFHTDDEDILTNGGKLFNTVAAYCYAYNSNGDTLPPQDNHTPVTAGVQQSEVPEELEEEEDAADEPDASEEEEEAEETEDAEVSQGEVQAVMKAPAEAWTIEYIMPTELYILERPNFYYNTTKVGTLSEYNSSQNGLTSTVTLQTDFSYMEGEMLGKFSMHTILPANADLTNEIKDADALFAAITVNNNLGLSANALKKNLSVMIEKDYQGSGRTKLSFFFDVTGDRVNEPEGYISLQFPIVVRETNLFRYGAEVTVRGVSYLYEEEMIVKPSSGIAINDGSYANYGQESIWSDIAGDGFTDAELSQSSDTKRKTSIAIAIEEGVTKLVATETGGGTFTIPSREKDENDILQYVREGIPKAELGSEYSYKLRMNPISDQGVSYATDIIFMDALETGELAEWQGELLEVDTSEAEALLKTENGFDVKAQVFYSETDYSSLMKQADYTPDLDTGDWKLVPSAAVRTIAVSFGDAQLTGDQQLTVTVRMRAPDDTDKTYQLTENETAVYYKAMASDGRPIDEQWLPSNPVAVILVPDLVQLRVIKTDEEDGSRLEDAVFDLYEWPDSNQPDPEADVLVKTNLTTNSKGEILVRDLPEGDYYLHEKQAPKGYQQKTSYEKLEVKAEHEGAEVQAEITNLRKLGMVTLQKVNDRDTTIPIEGAVFALYYKNGDTYEKIRDNLITNEKGQIVEKDLKWGEYYFVEISSPDGYEDPDSELKYPFTINAENDAGEELVITIENEQVPAKIRLIKYEKLENGDETSTPLANGFYVLYSEDNEELGTYMTDVNGEIILEDMTFGRYYFKESIAPGGYYLNEDKLEFELTAEHTEGGCCEVITYDQRKYGEVVMQKTDDSGSYVGNAEYGLYWLNPENQEYELYRPDVAYDNPVKTDEEGLAVFRELIWGEYYLQESNAPQGYKLDENQYSFSVNPDTVNEEIILRVEDERVTGSVRLVKVQEGESSDDLNYRLNGAVFNLYKTDGTLIREGLETKDVNGEPGVIFIDELEWGSYYFEEVKAPNGYSLNAEKIRFTVNYLTADIIQMLIAENPLQSKELKITKRIPKSSLVFAHGVPTFTFEITDGSKSWYRSVTFGEEYVLNYPDNGNDYVELSTSITGLENSYYTVTEVDVIRYEFEEIKNARTVRQDESAGPLPVINNTEQSVEFDFNGDILYGEVTFVNDKTYQESTSETVQINNILKSARKLTAITADYTEDSLFDNVIDRRNLDVWAVYDDGDVAKLADNVYKLLYFDGSEWTELENDAIPDEWLYGPYTIRVSYHENGVTRTADIIIQVARSSLFKWTVENGSASVYSYTGKTTLVIVPEVVTGYWKDNKYVDDGIQYTVTEITGQDEKAMIPDTQKAKVTRVVLPDTVASIGDYAFYECTGLDTVVNIPTGVTIIGDYAFSGCKNMSSELDLPIGLTYLGEAAFQNCSSLYGALTIPTGINVINDLTFYGCGFSGNLLIPDNITKIGNRAFEQCNKFTGDITIKSHVKEVGEGAFRRCTGFDGHITLEAGIGEIGTQAFMNCSKLIADVNIPVSIGKMNTGLFMGCTSLNGTVTIPEGITDIGSQVFYRCLELTGEIKIPGSVTTIGQSAFSNCQSFTKITIMEGVQEIGRNAFDNCKEVSEDLYIPGSVKKIGDWAFDNWTRFTGQLTLEEGLEEIGQYAFQDWTNCVSHTKIPESVKTIGEGAFNMFGYRGNGWIYFKQNSPLIGSDTKYPYGMDKNRISTY